MAAGGGSPLCGVLIFSGRATGSEHRRSRSAFGENRFDGDGGRTNSWVLFKLNSDLAGGGSVSNIGSDTAMGRRHLMAWSLWGVRERVG
jgi:hypothetical protein